MKVNIGKYPRLKSKNQIRKVDVKIHDFDTWNLDHTLSLIILPALIQFRKTKQAHPSDMTFDEWLAILDDMIWSFDQIANDEKDLPKDVSEENWKEEYLAYHERIQKGVELFGKHFRSLWD